MLKELRDEAEMDEWTKAILLDIKSLLLACDLKGPKLLQAVVDCRGVNDASRLKNLLDVSLRDLANYANDGHLPEDTPKGIAETGIPLMLDAALQTKITRTSDRLDLELLMPRSFQPLVNRLVLELAQEAGVDARLPFQSFAGTWKIHYSNDANRTYNIAPDGALKYGEDTFQLERTKEGVLLTHPSKTKELLRMDGETLRVRRYHYPSLQNGSSRFPGKPTVTGTGKRL